MPTDLEVKEHLLRQGYASSDSSFVSGAASAFLIALCAVLVCSLVALVRPWARDRFVRRDWDDDAYDLGFREGRASIETP